MKNSLGVIGQDTIRVLFSECEYKIGTRCVPAEPKSCETMRLLNFYTIVGKHPILVQHLPSPIHLELTPWLSSFMVTDQSSTYQDWAKHGVTSVAITFSEEPRDLT